jgi:hypothetical protein
MAASMERLGEYRTHNGQFCKRLLDFLSIMFKFQVRRFLSVFEMFLSLVSSPSIDGFASERQIRQVPLGE